jgi:hypothetical protein
LLSISIFCSSNFSKTKNLNYYRVLKLDAIKKLLKNKGWLKYVYIRKLSNNKMRENINPKLNIPKK